MSRIDTVVEENYDVVGAYEQDQINGFGSDTIELMLSLAVLESAETVLDAMAGDGNLTDRLAGFCEKKQLPRPETLLLEYSRVQVEFARLRLAALGTRCIWGDILEYLDRETGSSLPTEICDRLLIKSANHEIPWLSQQRLADNMYRLLRPDGLLVNLGFLLDDPVERAELAAFTRVKDRLAGMHMQAENRHFLLRDEYYRFLENAGFEIIRQQPITYKIESLVVAEQYFPENRLQEAHVEFQAAQLAARRMRANGHLRFHETGSVMELPGEITVARRLPPRERSRTIYSSYPYNLVRSMRCHAELRAQINTYIQDESSVLDLGCGPGFLAEELADRPIRYTGMDVNEAFITFASEHAGPQQTFVHADLNERQSFDGLFDTVCLVNVLYQENVNVHAALSSARAYLREGGSICVAGPLRKDSFTRIMGNIRDDLIADEIPFQESEFSAVVEANERLLREQGNYWSAEGMVALLAQFGFTVPVVVSTDLYYGSSYLIIAQKTTD